MLDCAIRMDEDTMDLIDRISRQFEDSARATLDALDALAAPIAGAVEIITGSLLDNGKVFACGSGRGVDDAMRFAAAMADGFEMERPPLAAIALPGGDEDPFSRRIGALGQPGDVLLAIATESGGEGIGAAIAAAHERDMRVIALTACDADMIEAQLAPGDVPIRISAERTGHVLQLQQLVLHCLCDGIDCLLLGVED